MPEIIQEWVVIDRWWTDDPLRDTWAEVWWWGHRVLMVLRRGERVWRVYRK